MTAGHNPGIDSATQAPTPSGETYLRRLTETELRHATAYPSYKSPAARGDAQPGPPLWGGMDRGRAAADVLTAAGAVDEATADTVLTELTFALAARAKVPFRMLSGRPVTRWNQRRLPAPGLPGTVCWPAAG